MALRDSLVMRKPDAAKVERITALFETILEAAHARNECGSILEELKEITGVDRYDEEYFRTLHSHFCLKEGVAQASLPRARRMPDLSHEELVDVTRRAMDVLSKDAEYYMALLDENVPMSGASNLIFYPPDHYDGDISEYNPTAEQIVSWATSDDTLPHRRWARDV